MNDSISNRGLVLKQLLPYINKYRNNCFLFVVPSCFLADGALAGRKQQEQYLLSSIWEDISACANLDIGCLVMIEHSWPDSAAQGLSKQEVEKYLPQIAATEKRAMALLARGFYGYKRRHNILAGSWFLAQSKGVLKGTDMQHYGKLRFIDRAALGAGLARRDIMVFSNLVPDKLGGFYAVEAIDLATEVALQLRADKVISYVELLPEEYKQQALDLAEAKKLLAKFDSPKGGKRVRPAKSAKQAAPAGLVRALAGSISCCAAGVKRAHIIPGREESALFKEILTPDGCGLMLNLDSYEELTLAEPADVPEIKKLIAPWEEKEVLRPRTYEELLLAIENFCVIKQDDNIIGCAALSPIPGKANYAELECVVVRDAYKQQGYGARLLNSMEKLAAKRGYKQLAVFTTQTSAWFEEAGFAPAKVKLPAHDHCRNSKCLVKPLGRAKSR